MDADAPRKESTNTSLLTPSPEGRTRAGARLMIALFIGLQIIVPLQYYASNDPYDERFSWRMFSAVRITRCQPTARERPTANAPLRTVRLSGGRDRSGRPVYGVIHSAWQTLIRRNRVAVIEAYLSHRCEDALVAEVSIENQCVDVGGRPLPVLRWRRDCATGAVASPEQTQLAAVRRRGSVR